MSACQTLPASNSWQSSFAPIPVLNTSSTSEGGPNVTKRSKLCGTSISVPCAVHFFLSTEPQGSMNPSRRPWPVIPLPALCVCLTRAGLAYEMYGESLMWIITHSYEQCDAMPIATCGRTMGRTGEGFRHAGIRHAGIEIFSLWVWLSSSIPFPTTHTEQGRDLHHTLTPPRSIVRKPFNAGPIV